MAAPMESYDERNENENSTDFLSDESKPLLINDRNRSKETGPRTLGKFGENLEENVTRRMHIARSLTAAGIRELNQNSVSSVFVVAFDTKSGNVVEWCVPGNMDLDGVEFKAMPSGSHTVLSDFIFFRKDNFFGLSCYEKMSVDNSEERGARMKSVGIMSDSYTNLYKHFQFLERQVRLQLETPGRYEQLKAFYEDNKPSLPDTSLLDIEDSGEDTNTVHIQDYIPHMMITHPAGCFSQFVSFFGVNIFTLWKFILLRKRIVFFSPPPVGVVCYRVYCASILGQHDVVFDTASCPDMKPFFYINIADIDSLETELSFVACTTEKVFEEKKSLYDVYVDNQNITCHVPRLKDISKVHKMDKEKYNLLNNQRNLHISQPVGEMREEDEEDQLFATFFSEQNNQIFQTLIDTSRSGDRTLTSQDVRDMGLDPYGDRQFLMDLIELYGFDVILMADNPCCPV